MPDGSAASVDKQVGPIRVLSACIWSHGGVGGSANNSSRSSGDHDVDGLQIPTWFPKDAAGFARVLQDHRQEDSQDIAGFFLGSEGDEVEVVLNTVRRLGLWAAPLAFAAFVVFFFFLACASVGSRRLRACVGCKCLRRLGGKVPEIPPRWISQKSFATFVCTVAVTAAILVLWQSAYAIAAAEALAKADCHFFAVLDYLVHGGIDTLHRVRFTGFASVVATLLRLESTTIAAAAATELVLTPTAVHFQDVFRWQVGNVSRVRHELAQRGVVWQEHRCYYCQELVSELNEYSRALEASLVGLTVEALSLAAIAMDESSSVAEAANRTAAALQPVPWMVANTTQSLWAAAGESTYVAVSWAPWGVAAFSSAACVAALVMVILHCWLFSQPSALEALGGVALKAHGAISDPHARHLQNPAEVISPTYRHAWPGDDAASRELRHERVDSRVAHATAVTWMLVGMIYAGASVFCGTNVAAAAFAHDASSLGVAHLLDAQLRMSAASQQWNISFARGTLASCLVHDVGSLAGTVGGWPVFSREVDWLMSLTSALIRPIDTDALEPLLHEANTTRGLHGSRFVHTDLTHLLPANLRVSTASRAAYADDQGNSIPGMWQYAMEINRLTSYNPAWTFTSMTEFASGCNTGIDGESCRAITADAPSDVEAHRDYGGNVAAELFRVARLKERVWVKSFGPVHGAALGQTLHNWVHRELDLLSQRHIELVARTEELHQASLRSMNEDLLSGLARVWSEPLRLSAFLKENATDCSWSRDTSSSFEESAARAARTLLAASSIGLFASLCFGWLFISAYRLWWWALRRHDVQTRLSGRTLAADRAPASDFDRDMVVPYHQ